jgi:hypothetical protein
MSDNHITNDNKSIPLFPSALWQEPDYCAIVSTNSRTVFRIGFIGGNAETHENKLFWAASVKVDYSRELEREQKKVGVRFMLPAIPSDICPVLKPLPPSRQSQSVRDSAAMQRLRCYRSLSPDTFPSRYHPRLRSRLEYVEVGCRVLSVERAVGGRPRGPHILHGRLCPIRPENFSAPCAKFASIPPKLQQAKLPRTTALKTHRFEAPCS